MYIGLGVIWGFRYPLGVLKGISPRIRGDCCTSRVAVCKVFLPDTQAGKGAAVVATYRGGVGVGGKDGRRGLNARWGEKSQNHPIVRFT